MPKKDFLKLFSMSLCFTLLQNMDLQKFHKIDENLTSGEVAQLKFLCMDLIPKNVWRQWLMPKNCSYDWTSKHCLMTGTRPRASDHN